MTTCAFRRGQVLNIKDTKYNRFYDAKVVKVSEDQQELRVHYIGWNQRYDEVLPMSSTRIGNVRRDAEVASSVGGRGGSTCKEPLNADVASCLSGMSGERDEAELSPGCSGGGEQLCGTVAAKGNACGFCLSSLSKVYISCSGCGKGFYPETLCVGVEEDVVSFVEG